METSFLYLVSLLLLPVLTVPMRNGNVSYEVRCKTLLKFLPYLWGMETVRQQFIQPCVARSYRTYEEWKQVQIPDKNIIQMVLTVPMRNGNNRLLYVLLPIFYVLTVPMRNGNGVSRWKSPLRLYCSYRTYEEWKLPSMGKNHQRTWVLTVPMRNGNSYWWAPRPLSSPFLPYLWGMETDFSVLRS